MGLWPGRLNIRGPEAFEIHGRERRAIESKKKAYSAVVVCAGLVEAVDRVVDLAGHCDGNLLALLVLCLLADIAVKQELGECECECVSGIRSVIIFGGCCGWRRNVFATDAVDSNGACLPVNTGVTGPCTSHPVGMRCCSRWAPHPHLVN